MGFLVYLLGRRYFLKFYFWLHWVFVAACRLSLVVVSGSSSPVVMHRLLLAVAAPGADHRSSGMPASVVAAHGL